MRIRRKIGTSKKRKKRKKQNATSTFDSVDDNDDDNEELDPIALIDKERNRSIFYMEYILLHYQLVLHAQATS